MANFKLTQTKEQIQADLDLLDKNSATAGQVLTANGTGGASWQNASGGGGGFTPRLIYGAETVSASSFDITNKETYFECKVKSGAGDLDSVTFTANVKCYVMIKHSNAALSLGKILNSGESITKSLHFGSPNALIVRVYPMSDYNSSTLTFGTLTIVEV